VARPFRKGEEHSFDTRTNLIGGLPPSVIARFFPQAAE
jgi:hypothetical protein